MSMQSTAMNVMMLVKNGTPLLAVKLLNQNPTPVATLMVADVQELLTVSEFSELKKYMRQEAMAEEQGELAILSDNEASELVRYAHRRDGALGDPEQPAPAPAI